MIRLDTDKGFTLIEVLVSLSIFMVIALIISVTLRTQIVAHDSIMKKLSHQRRVQKTLLTLQRDLRLRQAEVYTVASGTGLTPLTPPENTSSQDSKLTELNTRADSLSQVTPSLMLSDDPQSAFLGTEDTLIFTTLSPTGHPMRCQYAVTDRALIRTVVDEKSQKQHSLTLLNNVTTLSFTYFTAEGESSTVWSKGKAIKASKKVPHTIDVTITLAPEDIIRLVVS